LVHPIHKGKGKPREDPGSYRPVSILPAMSKVLETVVKGDLEEHLKRVNGLPGSQYGFRPKRSCTSALAHAQAGWLSGASKGKVVGLMAFDLSAAFDTVAVEQLVPTLRAMGISGRELRWFVCYMTGGRQSVVWDGTVGGLVDVLYGVRQGSILGPLLFIILTSGMANHLGVKEDENIVYADDSNVWQTGSSKEDVAKKLTEKAALFVEYTRKMGLSMNASKTQLLFSSRAGNVAETPVEVDGSIIYPVDTIELLGVRYDRKLSSAPHIKALLAAVRQRASVICRLANHLPRGEYLRQLSYGLVMGKFSHALAAVARPRLEHGDSASVIWGGIQVAFNDVARSITGVRRRDHVKIEDLLAQAGLESANRMVVKAIAAETWSCFHSDDGGGGARNHVGRVVFSDKRTDLAKTTRSAKTGQIEVPLRGGGHLRHACGPSMERVGFSSSGDLEGEGEGGGHRLGQQVTTISHGDAFGPTRANVCDALGPTRAFYVCDAYGPTRANVCDALGPTRAFNVCDASGPTRANRLRRPRAYAG
jgi:hypothetical protein